MQVPDLGRADDHLGGTPADRAFTAADEREQPEFLSRSYGRGEVPPQQAGNLLAHRHEWLQEYRHPVNAVRRRHRENAGVVDADSFRNDFRKQQDDEREQDREQPQGLGPEDLRVARTGHGCTDGMG